MNQYSPPENCCHHSWGLCLPIEKAKIVYRWEHKIFLLMLIVLEGKKVSGGKQKVLFDIEWILFHLGSFFLPSRKCEWNNQCWLALIFISAQIKFSNCTHFGVPTLSLLVCILLQKVVPKIYLNLIITNRDFFIFLESLMFTIWLN